MSRAAFCAGMRTLDKSLSLRRIEIPGKGGRGSQGACPPGEVRGSAPTARLGGRRPAHIYPPQQCLPAVTTRRVVCFARPSSFRCLPPSRCRQWTCSSPGSTFAADTPCFHPHSSVSHEARCLWGSVFRKIGCCHLSTDVCAHICMSASICRDLAVIRTRRFEFIPLPTSQARNSYAACFPASAAWPWRSGSYTSPVTHK